MSIAIPYDDPNQVPCVHCYRRKEQLLSVRGTQSLTPLAEDAARSPSTFKRQRARRVDIPIQRCGSLTGR